MHNKLSPAELQDSLSLKKQEKVIMTHLLYGTPEEKRILDMAYNDPELDPKVRTLITTCRNRLPHYIKREENPLSMPVKVQL